MILEDYLEAILALSGVIDEVHAIDIASYLGFSKPSVSHAMKLLAQQELIELNSNKAISLTAKGKQIAKETYHRHQFFADMLISLGVTKEIAQRDACRMEHALSQ